MVLEAINKVYSIVGYGEDVFGDIENGYLTENETRSGRDVVWYMDGEKECAVYVDTLEVLTEEEIETQLA